MSRGIITISSPEKVDMADDWYLYATLKHFWIRGRFRATMRNRALRDLKAARILEIGCGNGLVIQQFEKQPNIVVDGSDLNMFALEKVGAIKGSLYCLNIFDKPAELLNRYDAVLLMDVIEHIDDDAEFLRAGTNYLKPGGLVVINVPALNTLFSKYDVAVGHKRRYDKKMIRKLFALCDIEEVSVRYWGFTLLPVAILRNVILKFTNEDRVISTGFRPPNSVLNWLMDKVFALESAVLPSPVLGTSIIAIGRYAPGRRDTKTAK